MRPFEILIALFLVAFLKWPFLTGMAPLRAVDFLPLSAATITVFHLGSEGYRWQMVPLYRLAGMLLTGSIPALTRGSPSAYRFSWSAGGRAM